MRRRSLTHDYRVLELAGIQASETAGDRCDAKCKVVQLQRGRVRRG